MLETTEDSVPVIACCAPITSLLSRRDQGAGLRAGEERDRLLLHVAEHLGAQVVDEALADARGIPADHEAEESVEDRDSRDRDRDADHDGVAVAEDALVDDRPEQQRVDDGDQRVKHGRDQEQGQI